MDIVYLANNRLHTVFYLVQYFKYWTLDEDGNKIKNPAFDADCGKILDLKDPNSYGHQKAVAHFGRLLADRLNNAPVLKPYERIQIAIVPKSQAGKVSLGLRGVANKLANENKKFELPANDILTRTRTIEKLAYGGLRNVGVHLATIKSDIPISRKRGAVILLDDVATTGNSLQACTELLYADGAAVVFPIVIGRTA